MLYRVIGKMGGMGLGYILGFRDNKDMQEWRAKGWKDKEITFKQCFNKGTEPINDRRGNDSVELPDETKEDKILTDVYLENN